MSDKLKQIITLTVGLVIGTLITSTVLANTFNGPWKMRDALHDGLYVFEDRDNVCYLYTDGTEGYSNASRGTAISCLKK